MDEDLAARRLATSDLERGDVERGDVERGDVERGDVEPSGDVSTPSGSRGVAPASGERARVGDLSGSSGVDSSGVHSSRVGGWVTAAWVTGRRVWVAASMSLAFALVLSQLPFARLKVDDYIQRGALRGGLRFFTSRLDMFHFVTGEPAQLQAMKDTGLVPWFADPELRIGFFRPLSSALAVLDDWLFDGFAPGYLLHGGLWYVALCALAALWFQRHLPGLRGGLAAVGFALAACHQQPVVWFSARNSLVAAVLGMLAVLTYESARERGSRRLALGSALALALALSAGEAGLGAVAFIVAGELVAGCSWRVRWRRLAPTLAVVGLYFALYGALGYGSHASGAYIDPLREPARYLAALPARLITSLGVLGLGLPADLWFFVPATRAPMLLAGAFTAAVGAGWVVLAARRLSAADRRLVRLLLLATAGALLPQMAGPLGPRSYTLASVAGYGLLAIVVAQAFAVAAPALGRYAARAASGVLIVLHVLGGPLAWWVFARGQVAMTERVARRQAELGMDEPGLAQADYLVLSVPDPIVGMYTPFMRAAAGLPAPALWRALSFGAGDHTVVRTSAHGFELEVTGGDVLGSPFAELLHAPERASRVGDVVETQGLSARVLALSERGQPQRVEFTSRLALDDPRLHLFAWSDARMQPVRLAPGERRVLRSTE
jgi:hypothetical protein